MSFEKILRYIILTGIFVLPLAVLFVANSLFFPYITGKNFFFRIVVEIIFASWIILALINARYRPKMSLILGAATIFVAIIGLANIFGVNPARSFWSNFERMDGYITLLHLWAYLIVLVGVMNTEKLWRWFLNTLVGVSIIEGFYVLSQMAGVSDVSFGGARVDGTLGNPIYLAGFMLVMFFVTLWLLYRTYSEDRNSWTLWQLIFYVVALFLQVIGIFASGTRGSMLGLFGGLILSVIILALFAREHPKLRKVSTGVFLLFVVLGGLFLVSRDTEFVQNNSVLSRLASVSWREGTGQARLLLWGVALDGFKERPLLGWGQENYIQVFTSNYNPEMYGEEPWFDRAHNIVLDWLIAGGIVGVLGYLSIWVLLLWGIWRGSGFNLVEKSIFTGLLAAYFFHNLFVFDNVISYLLFFSLVGFIHSRREGEREWSGWQASPSVAGISSVVVGILAVLVIWQANVKPIRTAQDLIIGISLTRPPHLQVEEALTNLKNAQDRSFLGRAEARAQTAIAATAIVGENVPAEEKVALFNLADAGMKTQESKNPNSARVRILHGVLLKNYGQYEKAIEILEEGRLLSPSYQRFYEILGDIYFEMEEYQKALEEYEAAWRLDEEFHVLRSGSVKALIAMERADEARDIIFNESGGPVFVGGEVIQAFIDIEDFESAEKLIEGLIEQRKDHPQTLVSAAAAYLQIGQRGKAINLVEKAMELEPQFVEQGKAILREIEAGRNPLSN